MGLQVTTKPLPPGTDTFEPNDTLSTAYFIESEATSYISTNTDVDYFKLLADVSGSLTIMLKVPPTKDYDLYLYNSSGTLIGSSARHKQGNLETIIRPVSPGYYYAKVVGYQGAYSTLSYHFSYSIDGSGNVCPPEGYCQADEEMLLIPGETEIGESGLFVEISGEQLAILDGLDSEQKESRMNAYKLLSEIGQAGDVYILQELLPNINEVDERNEIQWTIAKIGYRTAGKNQVKAFGFLIPLFEIKENEEIQIWLKERLLELFLDEETVKRIIEHYEKQIALKNSG